MRSDSPRLRSQCRPDFSIEREWATARGPIAGVDEAGRGPWAGPVVAAAVVLDPDCAPKGLDDSKKLTPEKRALLCDALQTRAEIGIGIVSVETIDACNILQATLEAMHIALSALPRAPALALIDGNKAPSAPCDTRCIVGGDARSLSIAAASIVAKVTRDRIMTELARAHPGYGWERNKGYGTAEHRRGLARLGVTDHHRRSFAPIRNMLSPASREGLDLVGDRPLTL